MTVGAASSEMCAGSRPAAQRILRRSRGGRRQRESKCRALTNGCLRTDRSAVTLEDTPNDRETQTCAFKFALGVQPLKTREQVLSVGHIKTRAIVPDTVSSLASVYFPGDFDYRRRYALCEFVGV